MVRDRLAQGRPVPGVVGTLMTNMARRAGAARGAASTFVRAKVGDRYVLEELLARGWQLGGEGSGHLLALDKHTTGDGIVSALQVLQAVVPQRASRWPSCSTASTLFPQTLINVRLDAGQRLEGQRARWPTRRPRSSASWASSGRVLIRASGTEPVLRVMVEARDAGAGEALRRAHGARRR